MRRVTSFVPNMQVPSLTLNTAQDEQLGIVGANQNNDITATPMATTVCPGGDGRILQTLVSIANANLDEIDDTIDWRDRVLWGVARSIAATDRIGQANDFNLNELAVASIIKRDFDGYTGTGAVSNLATGAVVGAGAPPLNGVGAFRSYAVPIVTHLASPAWAWIYASAATGALAVYNNTGAALHLLLHVFASADTGKR